MTTINFPPNLLLLTRMIGELQTLASEQRHDLFLARADEALNTLDQWDRFQQSPFREKILEELRSFLSRPETRSDGLKTLDQLVRALADPAAPPDTRSEFARITRPKQNSIGPFWCYAMMSIEGPSAPRLATIGEWLTTIGLTLFDSLRYAHILYGEEGGAAAVYLYTLFDPQTGRLTRAEAMKNRWPGVGALTPSMANVILTYDPAHQRLRLEEPFAKRDAINAGLAQGLISPEVVRLIDSLDGQRVIFPTFGVPRQIGEGGTIPKIEPEVFQKNAHYAQTALEGMRVGTMETVLSVSVAPNGLLVGFQYWLRSAANKVYEVGVPHLGTKAIVSCEIYRNNISFEKLLWLPTGFKWEKRPNPYQKTAVLKWQRFAKSQVASGNDWRHIPRRG